MYHVPKEKLKREGEGEGERMCKGPLSSKV